MAEAGFLYDSSLAPYPFSGSLDNPRFASRLDLGATARGSWSSRRSPSAASCGCPAGSWTGRLASPERLVRAAREHRAEGGLPVAVVHPWEVSGRPTPGRLTGLAWFVHETGRDGFDGRFRELLRGLPWGSIRDAAGLWPGLGRAGASGACGAQPDAVQAGGFRIAGYLEVVRWREGLVRKGGLEPPRPCDHKILNLARLPIPPLSHGGRRPAAGSGF